MKCAYSVTLRRIRIFFPYSASVCRHNVLGLLTTSSASLAVPYYTFVINGEILTLMCVDQLRGSHHLLDYADDINLFLCFSLHKV